MQSIQNLKDPTTRIVVIFVLITYVSITTLQPVLGYSTVKDDASTNVSCIAHDTKFTCDCRNVNEHMLLPPLNGFVYQVEIRNCKRLTITANTFGETHGLRKISCSEVDSLVLQKNALAFPRYASNTPLIIEFYQVNFDIIDSHAINGNIEEISFVGGRIDVIQPFGFTTFKERALLLRLDRVLINRIESQAFKKFSVEQMEILNCIFNTSIPSKAFYELVVLDTLRITNTQFKEVHARAFSFQMISRLSISNNQFRFTDAEWLEAHILNSISIRDNNFGIIDQIAFKGIYVHRSYISSEPLELQFINNTVQFPAEPRPLEFNARFRLHIQQLQYDQQYLCSNLDTTQEPPAPKFTFFQLYVDSIYFRRIQTVTSSSSASMDENQSFVSLSKIIELDCQQAAHVLYIILGVLILAIMLGSVIIFMTCYLRRKKRKRRKLEIVQPETRTYKETQIVYQIENAGLLKTDL